MVNEISKIHKALKGQLIDLSVLIEECERKQPTPVMVRSESGKLLSITDVLRSAALSLEDTMLTLESAQLLFHK